MKVAIVGGAPSGKLAFDGEWDEVWGLGNQRQKYKDFKFTLLFEIHDDLSEHPSQYPEWLMDHNPCPVVVSEAFPFRGNTIVFPKEEAKAILGGECLSSSPAYMVAYAILQGATEIGIFGVDMAVDDHEYFKQRPIMYEWVGYAKGKGIKITIPDESSLCKDIYDEGRDWGKHSNSVFSEKEFLTMSAHHQAKMDEYKELYESHHGCRQVYDRLAKVGRAVESGQDVKHLTDSMLIKE